MTDRQRYLETMLFGKPDRVPFSPGGPRESTLKRWRSEGLPDRVDWHACMREQIGVEPAAPLAEAAPAATNDAALLRPLAEQVAEVEQRAIAAALRASGGNKQAAARALGISRATLYERLENPE